MSYIHSTSKEENFLFTLFVYRTIFITYLVLRAESVSLFGLSNRIIFKLGSSTGIFSYFFAWFFESDYLLYIFYSLKNLRIPYSLHCLVLRTRLYSLHTLVLREGWMSYQYFNSKEEIYNSEECRNIIFFTLFGPSSRMSVLQR